MHETYHTKNDYKIQSSQPRFDGNHYAFSNRIGQNRRSFQYVTTCVGSVDFNK